MVAKGACDPGCPVPGQGITWNRGIREELGVENEGVKIPSTVRWLSGAASVMARYNEKIITASSVVFAVADESGYQSIRRGGLRLQGRRYNAEAYEEIRPDVRYGHCAGWGHIESKCDRGECALWVVRRSTHYEGNRCPVEGCGVGKGHRCGHTVAKCANCGGPHFAQAKACPKKKAEGWRSPSPKWRQPAQAGQPEEPPTSAEGEKGGEMEVEEVRHELGAGEEMEE